MLLRAAIAGAAAAAADPKGFRGTLSTVHTYAIQDDPGDMVTSTLHDDRFEATRSSTCPAPCGGSAPSCRLDLRPVG